MNVDSVTDWTLDRAIFVLWKTSQADEMLDASPIIAIPKPRNAQ
jgi:hypothetical protein